MTERKRVTAAARRHCSCCVTRSLREGRCEVRLPSVGKVHCIGGTSYQRNHAHPARLADGIVLWSRDQPPDECAAVVEMKGGRVEIDVVFEQLQNAALIVEQIATDHADIRFAAVLVSNGMRAVDLAVLRGRRIRYRGRKVPIEKINCGASLDGLFPPRRK